MSASLVPGGLPGPAPARARLYASMVHIVRLRLSAARTAKVPAYVALPESNGDELAAMKAEQLVGVSEAGVITDHDSEVLVATTTNMLHLSHLKKIDGLKVLSDDLELLLTKATDNEDGDASVVCSGLVMNLDELNAGGVSSTIAQITRLCAVRSRRPAPWTLCCWFDGSLAVDELSPEARSVLEDDERFATLVASTAPSLSAPAFGLAGKAGEALVRALICLVPVLIACAVHAEGWHVRFVGANLLGHDVGAPVAALTLELFRPSDPVTIEQALDVLLGSVSGAEMLAIKKDGTEGPLGDR
jgi:hypothetical protein